MSDHAPDAVVGLDVGGTKTNATVLVEGGVFLVGGMLEVPSRVTEGPAAAIEAIREVFAAALAQTGVARSSVAAVGLDTPGPASAAGVISSRGATNFAQPEWWGFDFRAAVEGALGLPVTYLNDGNAAALYAHEQQFGEAAAQHSSVAAIVGTGLGGGVIVDGEVVSDERTELPQAGRRAVVHLGDTDIAFIQPDDTASGPLGAFLSKPQNGIYALVWKVADEAQAKAHFSGGRLQMKLTQDGCVSPGFAIDPEDFFGARHEFVVAAGT